jgi:hypothetical protein
MRRIAILFFCILPASAAYGLLDSVAEVNRRVAQIERALSGDRAVNLDVKSDGESEGSPPEIRFGSVSGKLVAARLSVGHEVWQSRVTIYFYEDGKPMKYLRNIVGRADVSQPQAIIYAPDGRVLWRNIEGPPVVDPVEVRAAYQAIERLRRAAARY